MKGFSWRLKIKFGEPEEVAGEALFLASEAGSFVTGEIIRVDGGQTI
jgi:NAD(P)-dependent dehydrogenase (short-subunit alcohol dehydrogenase family)